MNQQQKRRIAIGATRSEIRRLGEQPHFYTPERALQVLDDLLRSEPDLIASQWYDNASEAQRQLFRKEWAKWSRDTIEAIQQPIDDDDYREAKE